jgi:glycosyltransferase involved in cell wall biosynthesis
VPADGSLPYHERGGLCTSTAIFIPTYRRAHRIAALVGNVHEATDSAHRLVFIVAEDDVPTRAAVDAAGEQCIINTGPPTYAGAINTAFHATDDPYFFCGADDLRFYPGWLAHALAAMTDGIGVVGVNDLAYTDTIEGESAPHFLVRRLYIARYSGVIDQPNAVLSAYDHNYTDTEFVATARVRRMYRYCSEAIVEHLHPLWKKGEDDPIYEKGRRRYEEDGQRYMRRRPLWESR